MIVWFTLVHKFKNKNQRVNKRRQGKGSKKRARESIKIGMKVLPPIPAGQYSLSPSFSLMYLTNTMSSYTLSLFYTILFFMGVFTSYLTAYQLSSGRYDKFYPQRSPDCIIVLLEQFLNPVAPQTLEQAVSVKPSFLTFPSIGCLCSALRVYNCNDTIEIRLKRQFYNKSLCCYSSKVTSVSGLSQEPAI